MASLLAMRLLFCNGQLVGHLLLRAFRNVYGISQLPGFLTAVVGRVDCLTVTSSTPLSAIQKHPNLADFVLPTAAATVASLLAMFHHNHVILASYLHALANNSQHVGLLSCSTVSACTFFLAIVS